MTWPVPPAVPISPMIARMMSLAVAPSAQFAVDAHQHVGGLFLDQRLRRQHMLDLGGADAMRQRAKGAMRRGMAVAANDRRAGQGEALLRADDMHDALATIVLVVIFDAEFARVDRELLDLRAALRVFDRQRAIGGRHVVIDDGERLGGRAHLAPGQAQAFERLRTRHFMNEVTVDIEKAGAVILAVDHMVVPDFVVEGAGRVRIRLTLLILSPLRSDPILNPGGLGGLVSRAFDGLLRASGPSWKYICRRFMRCRVFLTRTGGCFA